MSKTPPFWSLEVYWMKTKRPFWASFIFSYEEICSSRPVHIRAWFLPLLASHLCAIWNVGNAAIFMTNGFLHWIAITGFNQFIISPSFWVLTVVLQKLIELAVSQGTPTRSYLATGEFFGWLTNLALISPFYPKKKIWLSFFPFETFKILVLLGTRYASYKKTNH